MSAQMDTKRDHARYKATVLFVAFLLVGAVGALDHATGPELSFSFFYLLPVSVVAWRVGVFSASLTAVLAAAVWMVVDAYAGRAYSHAGTVYWNTGIRLAFFLTVAISLVVKRRLETDVGRSQSRAAALFEFGLDAIVVIGRDGTIVQSNDKAWQLFGYTSPELLGMSSELLLPERFRSTGAGESGYISYADAGPQRISQELFGLRKNGTEFPLEVISSPMEAVGHHESMVVFRDMAVRRRLEGQLKHYEEGQLHEKCEAQARKLKGEINTVLQESGRQVRYDV